MIEARYDVGFGNTLFIRGKGAGLSWDKGEPMKNIDHDLWQWSPKGEFNECEFKVLINDSAYEIGENHHLLGGAHLQFDPIF